jgi:DNA-binding PadR family transcriptional regulator
MTRFNQFSDVPRRGRGPHPHGHEHGHGHGPWAAHEGFGPPWARGRGGRMRRGDIRNALLKALVDGPAHGYEIIRRLEEKSGGLWKPSPGSVYPTLQMLEEQDLLSSYEDAGKRVYQLTDAGRAEAEGAENDQFPWEGAEGLSGRRALRVALAQLALAVKQVQAAGDQDLVDRAAEALKEARQKLYQLLADS